MAAGRGGSSDGSVGAGGSAGGSDDAGSVGHRLVFGMFSRERPFSGGVISVILGLLPIQLYSSVQ